MSSSINLQTKIPNFKGSLVIARKSFIQVAVLPTKTRPFTNFTSKTQNLLQLMNPTSKDPPVLHRKISHRTGDEESVKETKVLMQRLETVGEKMRVMEMEKMMVRAKGQISDEEKQVVEEMSREIVNKIFEKPIQYLRCGDGKLEDRLKDLNFFVGMLERSCLTEGEGRTKGNGCLRNSHP